MDRLLARLERSFGKFGITGLPVVVVGGMAAAFVLGLLQPGFLHLLTLDPARVLGHGGARFPELWRLVTYIFIPNSTSPLWVFFELWFTWMVLSNLEAAWGAFRLTAFYVVGMICTTVAAMAVGESAGNLWLSLSALLAFATLFPNYEIYIFFVIPLKMKWAALLSLGLSVWGVIGADWGVWAAMIAGLANYILFCGGLLVDAARGRQREMKATARRAVIAEEKRSSVRPTGGRVCAICGAKEDDGADIRVCSCEKCGGTPRTLCLEHARNH